MTLLPLPAPPPTTVRCRGLRTNGRPCRLVLLREPWRSLGMGEDCAERAGLVVAGRSRAVVGSGPDLLDMLERNLIMKYRRKPQEIEAMQWLGNNEPALRVFTGGEFEALEECGDDPDATAAVRESEHGTWALLYTGDWVTRADGRLDRMRAADFDATYEPV